ncbi:hypothetical protein [Cellulomonas hominis]
MEGNRSGNVVSDHLRAELERLVEADQSRLGQVYRGLRRGLAADAIAAELGVRTSNFVWNYRVIAEALLDGTVPASPNIAKQAAGRCRALRSAGPASGEVRDYLSALEGQLNRRGGEARPPDQPRRAGSSEATTIARGAAGQAGTLVVALQRHLATIDRSVDVDVLEYRGLLTVKDVEGAFERLLNGGAACAAFRELEAAGRLDLTLEKLALSLGDQVSTKVCETAQGRLAYYRGREGRR